MSNILENSGENVVILINRLILEKHYDGVPILLEDNRNLNYLKENCSDAVQVCRKYLTDENYEKDIGMYLCCENLLKTIAQHAGQEEGLFELLEIIETTKSDNVFTSVLKALQLNILRQIGNKSRSLEWSLNSIQSYIGNLKFPEQLRIGYDEEEEKLLEDDTDIHRILTNYITIFLFYEPILNDVLKKEQNEIFRSTKVTRKNVLLCFILQLLDKPLAYLDLTNDNRKTNTHSLKCSRTLVNDASKLIGDPFFFLKYIENRTRWKKKYPKEGVYELASEDIFLIEEKTNLISYGILYYMLLSENLISQKAPKIYSKQYIFEMCLYLVHELLKCEEASLSYKGIKLGLKIIKDLGNDALNSDTFELKIHSDFSNSLCNLIIYSNIDRNRKEGFNLFKNYIYLFDDEGKYVILKNLMQNVKHNGLLGYLITTYKDLAAKKLNSLGNQLPDYVSGEKFRHLILNIVCKLKHNVTTDLMQNSDHIISSLNVIRFFAIRDKLNQTGFWDFVNDIHMKFLTPLRKAIDMSRAHVIEEKSKVKIGKDSDTNMKSLIDISLMSGEDFPDITKEQKLQMLTNAMLTFDVVESLLARVVECTENFDTNKIYRN